MNCFKHDNDVAVATCKSCGKALCKNCVLFSDGWIVCSEECKNEAKDYRYMMNNAKKLYGIQKGRIPVLIIFTAIPGVLFTLAGVNAYFRGSEYKAALALGLFFLVITLLSWINQKKTKIIQ